MANKFLSVEFRRLTQDDFQISVGQAKYSRNFDGIKTLILGNIITSYQELRSENMWRTLTSEPDFSDLLVERLKRNPLFLYVFKVNRETQEGFYTKKGYLDVKIDIPGTVRYFAFECKRLDEKTGKRSLQQAYIDEGLHRFVTGKYAKNEDFGGMIGFVVAGRISIVVQDMKAKVKDYCFASSSESLLDISCDRYPTSFQSKHSRENSLDSIHVYHLLFDFAQ